MRLGKHSRGSVVGLVWVIAATSTVPALAKTVYVSPTGNSANDGLTWETAKLTVQEGLNTAVADDQVWVAAGTYVENITLKQGVALYGGFAGNETELAQRDWTTNETILDGNQAGSVVTSPSGATATTRIDGFTIRNGSTPSGGGVYCSGSSPTFANNRITANSALSGGGVYCSGASPSFQDCVILGNTGQSSGGGVYLWDSPTHFSSCVITGNEGQFEGGGVYLSYRSDATFSACDISGNTAEYTGGGIHSEYSAPVLSGCTVARNTVTQSYGGGIYCIDGGMAIDRTVIDRNIAAVGGGGLACGGTPALSIASSLISRNVANEGGGLLMGTGTRLTNCTVVANRARVKGGGAGSRGSTGAALVNCILWGNTAPNGSQLSVDYSGQLAVCYSDVQGGQAAVSLDNSGTVDWQSGNIEVEPGFAFPDDFRLASDSPCIDTGTPIASGMPTTDLDGIVLFQDGDGDGNAVPDMGAYESQLSAPSIALSPPEPAITVLQEGPTQTSTTLGIRNCGGGTLTWSISEACPWLEVIPSSGSAATQVQSIELRADRQGLSPGLYSCTLTITGVDAGNSPRTVPVTFRVARTRYVPAAYPTIQAAIDAALDGDLVLIAPGTYTGIGNRNIEFRGKAITVRGEAGAEQTIIDGEGVARGFKFTGEERPAARLEGIQILNGLADLPNGGSGEVLEGGAVYVGIDAAPAISNCIMRSCRADAGGGLYCDQYSQPTILNCRISGNNAILGAGVCCVGAGPVGLANCVIDRNTAMSWTGSAGGGLYVGSSQVSLLNCTIVYNRSDEVNAGGGIYTNESNITIANSILWGNVGGSGSQLRSWDSTGRVVVSYCDVQGGPSGQIDIFNVVWGPGVIDAEPRFAFKDDYHLMAGSPCADTGTNQPDPEAGVLPSQDLDGKMRILDGDGDGVSTVDMGACERSLAHKTLALSPEKVEFFVAQGGPSPMALS